MFCDKSLLSVSIVELNVRKHHILLMGVISLWWPHQHPIIRKDVIVLVNSPLNLRPLQREVMILQKITLAVNETKSSCLAARALLMNLSWSYVYGFIILTCLSQFRLVMQMVVFYFPIHFLLLVIWLHNFLISECFENDMLWPHYY